VKRYDFEALEGGLSRPCGEADRLDRHGAPRWHALEARLVPPSTGMTIYGEGSLA
jgi:hypothetical protein